MISKSFKLYKEGHLVSKQNSKEPKDWIVKKPTFSFVERVIGEPMRAIFKCRQTGELVNLRCKAA